MRVRTAGVPARRRASAVYPATARFTVDSLNPLGAVAPGSSPPWPGSRTTVVAPMGWPPTTVAVAPHGVCTFHRDGPPPTTGTTTPRGDTTAPGRPAGVEGRTASGGAVGAGPGAGGGGAVVEAS